MPAILCSFSESSRVVSIRKHIRTHWRSCMISPQRVPLGHADFGLFDYSNFGNQYHKISVHAVFRYFGGLLILIEEALMPKNIAWSSVLFSFFFAGQPTPLGCLFLLMFFTCSVSFSIATTTKKERARPCLSLQQKVRSSSQEHHEATFHMYDFSQNKSLQFPCFFVSVEHVQFFQTVDYIFYIFS